MSSDTRIQHDIESALDGCDKVDSHQIDVAVRDGIVTLSGQVSSYVERRAADEAAQSIAGVKAVANGIAVELPFGAKHSDADIAAAAVDALKENVSVPVDGIKVLVRGGCIELRGQVDNWHQRSAAELTVMSLDGVKSLLNNIFIHARVSVGDVENKIEDALQLRTRLDAKKTA